MIESCNVSQLIWMTNQSATARSKTSKLIASNTDISPVTKGLSRVLSTNPSRFLSVKSLVVQPAERITKAPTTNVMKRKGVGKPDEAIISPQSAGANSKYVPIGLSKRITRNKAANFPDVSAVMIESLYQ